MLTDAVWCDQEKYFYLRENIPSMIKQKKNLFNFGNHIFNTILKSLRNCLRSKTPFKKIIFIRFLRNHCFVYITYTTVICKCIQEECNIRIDIETRKLRFQPFPRVTNPLKYVQTFRISIFHSVNGLITYQSIVEAGTYV